MSASPWDPAQYERFKAERRQPLLDLLAFVSTVPGGLAADLGCGTGEGTRDLHRHTGARETTGVDDSDTMLDATRPFGGGGVRFERADLASWRPQAPLDVLFSNAALHWLPGHEILLARLTSLLAPGGQLAFQVPAMDGQPTHVTADELAAEPPFAEALGGKRPTPVLPPETYAALFDRFGYREVHVRLQIYPHHLPSREDAVEWVKGSLLTFFARRLGPDLYALFLERYRERLLALLPDESPLFFPYRRILVRARLG